MTVAGSGVVVVFVVVVIVVGLKTPAAGELAYWVKFVGLTIIRAVGYTVEDGPLLLDGG